MKAENAAAIFKQNIPWHCPSATCGYRPAGPNSVQLVRIGFFLRKSDGKRMQRLRCPKCMRGFSEATLDPCYRQKKRQLNDDVRRLEVSLVSQRRIAILLHLHRRTIDRKLRFLGQQSRIQLRQLVAYSIGTRGDVIRKIQFDELESFEHSRLRPVAIPLVVCAESRLILAVDACPMAPKSKSAERARKKYGTRTGRRSQTLRALFNEISSSLAVDVEVGSDLHPLYPAIVARCLPFAIHRTHRSRRAHSTGQGELKSGAHDPLYSVNHTAAMLRANVSRLIRKTWCTTKRIERLRDHLAIYAVSHNLRILGLSAV